MLETQTTRSPEEPLSPPPYARPRPSRPPRTELPWERRLKWLLLTAAVALVAWTGTVLVQTLLLLAEQPVAVAALLPPPEPLGEHTAGPAEPAPGLVEASGPSEPEIPAALEERLARMEQLLERVARSEPPRQAASTPRTANPKAMAPSRPQSTPLPTTAAVQRAVRPRKSERARAPALRVAEGPKVRLIGADALVEARLHNRSTRRLRQDVVLELRVDGRRRQQRRLRLDVPAGAQVHVSERFSTTLPDGTYSATLRTPRPLG